MEYNVLTGNDISEIIDKVNTALRCGWQCVGGIYVLRYEWQTRDGGTQDDWWYYQAVQRAATVAELRQKG